MLPEHPPHPLRSVKQATEDPDFVWLTVLAKLVWYQDTVSKGPQKERPQTEEQATLQGQNNTRPQCYESNETRLQITRKCGMSPSIAYLLYHLFVSV